MTNCHYTDVKYILLGFLIYNMYVYVLFRYKLNKKLKTEKNNEKRVTLYKQQLIYRFVEIVSKYEVK